VEQAESLRRRQTYGPLDEAVTARLSQASDAAKEGLTMAAEIAGRLKNVPGVRAYTSCVAAPRPSRAS